MTECWVVTDGTAGTEIQCLGLTDRLALEPVVKRVRPRLPWRLGMPYLRLGLSVSLAPDGDRLAPPWPHLVVAAGRHSLAAGLYARRAGGGRTRLVQIQNPRMAPSHFDLVIAPKHDRLRGPNVIETHGSLHGLTPEVLVQAARRWRGMVPASGTGPVVAVLIGGSNGAYRMTDGLVRELAEQLHGLAASGARLLLTTSRRTGAGAEAILRNRLAGVDCYIWDGMGPNPYVGLLGLADQIIVTGDSVNMVSEAAATGRPVHVFHLGGGTARFERFHGEMVACGAARPFAGRLGQWTYTLPDDTGRAAAAVRRLLEPAAGPA